MIVKVRVADAERVYTLEFWHTPPLNALEMGIRLGGRRRRATTCRVYAGAVLGSVEGLKPIGMGVAHCSSEDQFRRAEGRRIALDKALRNAIELQRAKVDAAGGIRWGVWWSDYWIDDEAFRAVVAGYEAARKAARARSLASALQGALRA